MRMLLLACSALAICSAAQADPSYTVTNMSCAKVQSIVKANGSVVLHYRSAGKASPVPLYERFVSDSRYCDSRQTITFASVPTADKKACNLRKCASVY
jgi:hypothetical protein